MKKIILFVIAIVVASVSVSAQVSITSVEEKYDYFEGTALQVEKSTGRANLYINSDNQYEDESIKIPLGETPEEVLKSLDSIINLINSGNQFDKFSIYGMNCTLLNAMGKYLYFDAPAHTAGSYRITKETIVAVRNAYNDVYVEKTKTADQITPMWVKGFWISTAVSTVVVIITFACIL